MSVESFTYQSSEVHKRMSSGAVGMQVRVHKDIDDVSKERKKRDKKFRESLSSHRLQRPRSHPPPPVLKKSVEKIKARDEPVEQSVQ